MSLAGENLARGRPATQSSWSMFSNGSRPEDDAAGGNNGEITGGAGFHTGFDHPAWWLVDLQRPCRIAQIRIYNRLGFGERLRHFSVLFSFDGENWERVHQKTDDSEFGGADGHPFDLAFAPAIATRFIKVQQDDDMFLHFDELQAFGSPDDAAVAADADTPPRLAGRAALDFAATTAIAGFGLERRHQRLSLIAALMPPPQLGMHNHVALEPIIAVEHYQYPLPPPVAAYAVHGARLWGSGLVTHDDRFVLPPDCFPGYLGDAVHADGHRFTLPLLEPARWAARQHIHSARPVASVLHPNLIFGHFLLEMLPRFYVAAMLRQMGADFVVALPNDLPAWIGAFADLYFAPSDQLRFDPATQVIDAPSIVLASMMHEHYNFHPAFNLLVADLRARVGLPPWPGDTPRDPATPRRIYLSRSLVGANNRLQNEAEIEARMQQLGFALVHPQRLSIREQLVVFDGAEVVAGEYSSALHNTLFCRPGTRVIAIDYHSWYQSALGRLRQQPHGFVVPDDGHFRHWRSTQPAARTYRVDPAALQAMVMEMVPDAGTVPAVVPVAVTAPVVTPVATAGGGTGAWAVLLDPNPPPPPPARRGFWRRLLGART